MLGTIVVSQRHDFDCGYAAIAMLLNVPYGDVSKAVRDNIDDPKLKKRGLILWQMEEVLKAFKFKTKRVYRSKGYLEGATGILGLNGGLCAPAGHWVVIKDGMIIDPSGGEVWEVEDYVKAANCRPATLLVID